MNSNQKETREIDLIELFKIIGSGIKNLFVNLARGILFIIVFGIRRIHFLIIFAVAGALIGLLLFSTTKRYYSSNLIAQPNGISAEEMVNYINDLNKFCKYQNTPALSYALALNDSISEKIKNIEAFYYIDVNGDYFGDIIDLSHKYNPQDTTQRIDQRRIFVQVEVYDNTAFSSVRKGIYSYISKNPYLIKLNEIRKQELTELISYSQNEINKLDSLQNVDYFKTDERLSSTNDNRLMFLSEKDKQMYYRDKMVLLSKKQEYIKELELATEPITIIKDFTQLSVEENPKGKYMVLFGFLFGVVGFIVIIIRKYFKSIIEIIK